MTICPPMTEIADTANTPPAIALIYADIRATTGSAVVNLVFRRLAAMGAPVLAMVWHGLRPAYADARLDRLAALLAPALPKAGGATLSDWATRPEGAVLRRIVLEYDRNNRRNLIAFSALLAAQPQQQPCRPDRARRNRRAAESVPPDPWEVMMQGAPLSDSAPPMPDAGTLDPQTRACLERLDCFGDPGSGPPRASLYRHLAAAPGFLLAAEARLAPLHASGTLTQATMALSARAEQAARLLPDLTMDPAFQARIDPAIGALVRRTIPKMVPIGRLLGTLLLPAPMSEPGA
ncbi:MAG: hypothetical protein JJU15_05115 [Pararhodobacter sp.]|nr:hypothetical protein [Pararhodobacter sp.]